MEFVECENQSIFGRCHWGREAGIVCLGLARDSGVALGVVLFVRMLSYFGVFFFVCLFESLFDALSVCLFVYEGLRVEWKEKNNICVVLWFVTSIMKVDEVMSGKQSIY